MNIKVKLNDLIFFRYKAIGEGTLPWYDKTPLVLVLDIRKDNILGLNMHWVDKKYRAELFNDIQEIMAKTEKVGQQVQRKRMTYMLLRKKKFRVGLGAIRMYYTTGITQFKNIPEKQWSILFGYGVSQYKKRVVWKKTDYKD